MKGISFVVGEIALLFLMATAIGIGIGWVLRDWVFANRAEELDLRLRQERGDFRRLESSSASRERQLIDALTKRDEVIEAFGAKDSDGAMVLVSPSPRPGGVMRPGTSSRLPRAQAPSSDTTSVPRDDLQQLRGVGPTIEKRMNGYGITAFGQLAALSEDEVEELAHAIRVSPGRILRDEWVGAAANLDRHSAGSRL